MTQDPPTPSADDSPPPDQPTVLERVEARTGASARVLLRGSDSLEAESPIVDPQARKSVAFRDSEHHYQIQGEIARGGMGVILKAQDTELGREVAIKVLDERFKGLDVVLRRFVEEAQIGGQLQHPGVIPVYELGMLEDDRPFICMKLVKGRTLSALLSARRSATEDRHKFLSIFESVCQTVAYAHSKGVIHRDLKPANVMVGAFGEVQVGDWGLAKVLGHGGVEDEERALRSHLTVVETVRSGPGSDGTDSVVGSVMGTPEYMPPEQAMGEIEKIDERADVFALGAILCEILTGRPPYVATESERTVVQAAHGRLDAARERVERCDADEELKTLALECLAPARMVRPQNAGEVARRLHEHMASVDERARAAEVAAAEARIEVAAARRARLLTVGLATAVVAAVLAGGAFLRSRAMARIEQAAQVRHRLDSDADQVLALQRAGQLTEALELARNALGDIEGSEWADDDLRARATSLLAGSQELVDAANARAELKARDGRLQVRLDDIRVKQLEMFMNGQRAELDDQYLAAFEDYGVTIDLDHPERSVEALRASSLSLPIAAALDDWAWIRRELSGWDAYDAEILTALALDVDPDPGRAEVRQAILAGDYDGLKALAASARERGFLPETQFSIFSALYSLAESRNRQDRAPSGDIFKVTGGLYPDDFLMNCVEAMILRRDQLHSRALPALRAAVALRPQNARVRFYLGQSLAIAAESSRALPILETAGELGFDEGEIAYWRGLVLWDLGRFAESEAELGHAAELAPENRGRQIDHLGSQFLAGQVSRDDFVAAMEALDRPTPGELLTLANGLLDRPGATHEDAQLVLDTCRRVRAMNFDDPYLFEAMIESLLEVGDCADVLTEIERWQSMGLGEGLGQDAIVAAARARCHARNGNRADARLELELARKKVEQLTAGDATTWERSRVVRHLRKAEAEVEG